MPDLSVLAHRLYDNTKVLEAYDEAVRHFKQNKSITKQDMQMVQNLLSVLNPVLINMGDMLSNANAFSVDSVVRIVKQKQGSNWQHYKRLLDNLVKKITSVDSVLIVEDFHLLDDIGDALDSECANLFRRMGKR